MELERWLQSPVPGAVPGCESSEEVMSCGGSLRSDLNVEEMAYFAQTTLRLLCLLLRLEESNNPFPNTSTFYVQACDIKICLAGRARRDFITSLQQSMLEAGS